MILDVEAAIFLAKFCCELKKKYIALCENDQNQVLIPHLYNDALELTLIEYATQDMCNFGVLLIYKEILLFGQNDISMKTLSLF